MGDAVEQGCRHLWIAEHSHPLTELQVRCNDQRNLFIKLAGQVKQ